MLSFSEIVDVNVCGEMVSLKFHDELFVSAKLMFDQAETEIDLRPLIPYDWHIQIIAGAVPCIIMSKLTFIKKTLKMYYLPSSWNENLAFWFLLKKLSSHMEFAEKILKVGWNLGFPATF